VFRTGVQFSLVVRIGASNLRDSWDASSPTLEIVGSECFWSRQLLQLAVILLGTVEAFSIPRPPNWILSSRSKEKSREVNGRNKIKI